MQVNNLLCDFLLYVHLCPEEKGGGKMKQTSMQLSTAMKSTCEKKRLWKLTSQVPFPFGNNRLFLSLSILRSREGPVLLLLMHW